MRFVTPESVRIWLDGEEGRGDWIEVKKELTVGEERRYRTAGFKGMRGRAGGEEANIDVDFAAMALARVKAYVVEWSAKDANDKPVRLTDAAIENLDAESFEKIDTAIQQHIAAVAEGKTARSGSESVTA